MTNNIPPSHNRKSIRLKGYDYSQAGMYFITICCGDRECRFGKITDGKMELNEYGTIAYNEWIKLSARFTNSILDVFQIMPNHIHGIIVLKNVITTLAVAQINTTNNIVGAGLAPAPNNMQPNELIDNNNDYGQMQGITDNDNYNGQPNWLIDNKNDNRQPQGITDNDNYKGQPQGITDNKNDNRQMQGITDNDNDKGQPNGSMENKNDNGQPQGLPQRENDVDNNKAWVNRANTIGEIVGAYKSLVANECLKIYKSKNKTMGKLWQRNYYEHIIRNEKSYQTIADYIIHNPLKWKEDRFFLE